jgi:hypothetical protein
MNGEAPARDSALFLQLLLGLHHSGMIALGKLQNPMTGAVARQMELARDTIDTLAAIEARTRGQLTVDEGRALQHVLSELRLNYVDEVKKPERAAETG